MGDRHLKFHGTRDNLPTGDGLVVIALWDSKASWERFRDETLMPGLEAAEGTFETPPETTTFDIHREQS